MNVDVDGDDDDDVFPSSYNSELAAFKYSLSFSRSCVIRGRITVLSQRIASAS